MPLKFISLMRCNCLLTFVAVRLSVEGRDATVNKINPSKAMCSVLLPIFHVILYATDHNICSVWPRNMDNKQHL